MKDDYLCKEFRKDVASLEKNRKTVLKETAKSKDVYNIGLHRYIGYDRKVYFKDRLKSLKFKKKNEYNVKDEAKRTKAATKKKKTVILPETPPAGPFPSFMIEMKNGYPVEKIHLEKNDVFLNYNYILDTEIERIKNVSQKAVFVAISPNEKEKFLIKEMPNLINSAYREIEQLYISYEPEIRIIKCDSSYFIIQERKEL